MGKVLSIAKHPFRNFNLESRAHKVISQSKPIPAPRHQKDEIDVQRLMKEYPGVYEESLTKNKKLNDHLKDIFVTSHDPVLNMKQEANPEKPLPLHRGLVEDFMYGTQEPKSVPLGKATLRQALEFISKHQNDPRNYNVAKISEEFKLPEEKVKSILKYFRVFEIYVPDQRNTKAKFAGPSLPKVELVKAYKKAACSGTRRK